MLALTLNLVGKSNCWVSSRRRHTKWVVSHMFEEKQIYMTVLHWLSHHSFHYYNTSTCITLIFTPLLSLFNIVVHQLTFRISSIVLVNTYSQSCHLLIVHITTFVIAWFIILLRKLLNEFTFECHWQDKVSFFFQVFQNLQQQDILFPIKKKKKKFVSM